jgi:3-isopropylmalate/(R)-2-methylmalate dehydratase small subunit
MKPFTVVSGVAAPLPAANVDTDVIMPKQFLKGIDRAGLDRGALHDLRFDAAGEARPDFILNQPAWRGACFLVVGPNFGCGSSREHAVWGLAQLGVRAVIGTSFAGIFADNCARNGLLLVALPKPDVDALLEAAARPDANGLTVDLQAQTVTAEGLAPIAFDIEPTRKAALLQGLDAIGETLQRRAAIDAFEMAHRAANPWLHLSGSSGFAALP